MPPESPAGTELAREILERAAGANAARGDSDPVATADMLARMLAIELSRSFGPFGYHALLVRALARARPDHPILAAVRVRTEMDPALDGLAAGVQAHGVEALAQAMQAVLSQLIDLLGRVIGADMATRLVGQAIPHVAANHTNTPDRGNAP